MSNAQALLDRIRIASPCPADWAAMTGDERSRHCALCERRVYDLSTMTAEEALVLIREKEGRLCVRLWQRADGTVITADCPVGSLKLRRRSRIAASMAAASLLAIAVDCARPLAVPASPEPLATCASLEVPPTQYGTQNGMPTATVTIVGRRPVPDRVTVGIGIVPSEVLEMGGPLEGPTQGRAYGRAEMDHLPLR